MGKAEIVSRPGLRVAPCRTTAAHPLPFPLLALSGISKGHQCCRCPCGHPSLHVHTPPSSNLQPLLGPREGLQYLEHNYTKKNIPAFLKFKCNRMSCVSPGGPSHRGPHQPSGGLSGGPGWGTFTGPVSELKSPGQGLPGSLHWGVLVGHTGSGWAHPGPTDFAGEKRVRSGSSKAQELQRGALPAHRQPGMSPSPHSSESLPPARGMLGPSRPPQCLCLSFFNTYMRQWPLTLGDIW